MPKRIQRKRTKGWTSPEGAVYVGRGSKWGNPFVVNVSNKVAVDSFRIFIAKEGSWSPIPPSKWPRKNGLTGIPAQWTTVEDVKRELRGKDLMCWCRLDEVCHADELLRIANE